MKCQNCKIFFKKRKTDTRDKNKFCSSVCALNKVRTREHQVSAGKKGALTNIKKYRGTGNSYIREIAQHQHRAVMEKFLKRKLKKGEIVHHKDGNKQNNSIENLELMTQAEHARRHYHLSGGSSIKKAINHNTKYGPICARKGCKLPNKIGRKYCPKHQWRFIRYGEI